MVASRFVILLAGLVVLAIVQTTLASPAIVGRRYTAGNGLDLMGGFDFLGICIRNCAQCKKMYGSYFEGQQCADACVKFKGKIIPDCEDIGSIAPFLNKFE